MTNTSTTATTYHLLTLIDGKLSGIEPVVADTEDTAIAFASGVLNERIKGDIGMFLALKVRWGLDTGNRDLGDVMLETGPALGAFDIVTWGGGPRLVWSAL